jgi:hypothetical protein
LLVCTLSDKLLCTPCSMQRAQLILPPLIPVDCDVLGLLCHKSDSYQSVYKALIREKLLEYVSYRLLLKMMKRGLFS